MDLKPLNGSPCTCAEHALGLLCLLFGCQGWDVMSLFFRSDRTKVTLTRSDIYSVVQCNEWKLEEVNTRVLIQLARKNTDFPVVSNDSLSEEGWINVCLSPNITETDGEIPQHQTSEALSSLLSIYTHTAHTYIHVPHLCKWEQKVEKSSFLPSQGNDSSVHRDTWGSLCVLRVTWGLISAKLCVFLAVCVSVCECELWQQ